MRGGSGRVDKYHYLLDITKDKIDMIEKEKGIAGIDRDALSYALNRVSRPNEKTLALIII